MTIRGRDLRQCLQQRWGRRSNNAVVQSPAKCGEPILQVFVLSRIKKETVDQLLVMGWTVFDVRCPFVRRQNLVFEFDYQEMNTFSVRSMFGVLFDKHLVNIKLPKRMLFYVGIQHFFATFEKFSKLNKGRDSAKSYLIRLSVFWYDSSHFKVWKK